MQNRTLYVYMYGVIFLLLLIYTVILRHPGYIFFWDLSGSFSFNDPFDQYFSLFTPWDGMNIGVKNRLPITIIIYFIFKPLQAIFGFQDEAVIKIAISLLLLGAYTAFFILFPKWFTIIRRKITKRELNSKTFLVLRLVLSLIYLFIPFYAYRLSQMHIFYMSTFYPIHCYLFLRILSEKKVNYSLIAGFIISMFFGLTSPHIMFVDLITFTFFLIPSILRKIKKAKLLIPLIKNLALSGIGVLATNIYWLVPYIFVGAPMPGYVITESTLNLLTQETTLFNFLVGQSDWFVGQADLFILDSSNWSILTAQILGLLCLYVFATYALLKLTKKPLAVSISLILLATLFLVVSTIPFHETIFDTLVYSPIGWVIREANKLQIMWSFWTFLLFSVGITSIITISKPKDLLGRFFKSIILPSCILYYLALIIPINSTFFTFLKPIEVDESITQVYELLEKDRDYFYVHYHPRNEPYRIPWKEERFIISDAVDYDFLPYNSPKPPVYLSTVVPHAKTYHTLLTEYLIENRDSIGDIAPYLAEFGVKYVVVRKEAIPIRLEQEVSDEYIMDPMLSYLSNNESFSLALTNTYYDVYKNESFITGLDIHSETLYTTEGLSLLSRIDPEVLEQRQFVFCNFPENIDLCTDDSEEKTFLRDPDNYLFFLDLLDEVDREAYSIHPYDFTKEFGINIDWGRASFYDRINGELHNVFKNYGISAWDFNISDKVVYSDKPFLEDTSSILTFYQKAPCVDSCGLYAYVLHGAHGGNISIQIDDVSYEIDTRSDSSRYLWIQIDEDITVENEEVRISIVNEDGFNSVGPLLLIPKSIVLKLRNDIYSNNLILELPESGEIDLPEILKAGCTIDSVQYSQDSLVPQIEVMGDCHTPSEMTIRSFPNHYLTFDRSENLITDQEYTELSTGKKRLSLYLITYYDVTMWLLFILSSSGIITLSLYIYRHRKPHRGRSQTFI